MYLADISIGRLAKATGFSVERLRMWELRYGRPQGERLPSGHRRYSAAEVERLHLVRTALERGMRPRQVVALDREALLGLLEAEGGSATAGRRGRNLPWSPAAWIDAARRVDDAALERAFHEHWLELGGLRFLRERAQPLLLTLGEQWREGSLCAAEEHFVSEKLGDFLSGIWRGLNQHNDAGPVLLTTLPGERHRLGLQMAALVCTLAGLRVLYLGPDTPITEVARIAEYRRVGAVLLSVALGVDPGRTGEQLRALRAAMPTDCALGIGGAGAPVPQARDPWLRFDDLDAFFVWGRSWRTVRKGKTTAAAV